jgi:hypothetical protein
MLGIGLSLNPRCADRAESSMGDDAASQAAAAPKVEQHALEHTDEDDDVTSKQHSPVNMQHEPAMPIGSDTAVHALELARLRLSQDRADQPNGDVNSSGDLTDETAGQHSEANGVPLPLGNGKRTVRSLSDPVNSRRTEVATQVQQQQQQQQQGQQPTAAGGFHVPPQLGLSQQLAASAGADVGAALERLLQLHTAQVGIMSRTIRASWFHDGPACFCIGWRQTCEDHATV